VTDHVPGTSPALALAVLLNTLDEGGPPGLTPEGADDLRREAWDALRLALAGEDAADDRRAREVDADAAVFDCSRRLARILDDDPGASHAALDGASRGTPDDVAGEEPERQVVHWARVLDRLRMWEAEGAIDGALGWALRRWGWDGLRRAVALLRAEDPAAARAAERRAWSWRPGASWDAPG